MRPMRIELPWDAEWPQGYPGVFAVCAWLKEGWSFEVATDRAHAEMLFAEARRQPGLMVVRADQGMHQGAVIWIAQCEGGTEWQRIKETKAATALLDEEGW